MPPVLESLLRVSSLLRLFSESQRPILISMSPLLQDRETTAGASSFAGVLAGLTAPAVQPARSWTEDLQDDVATLSYESALKRHARSRGLEPSEGASPTDLRSGSQRSEAPQQAALFPEPRDQGAPALSEQSARASAAACERNRKRASVTVRMSEAECAQLRQRAAEAGMTVSAYLRSCAFEVETLRAQVKQVVAEMRKPPQNAPRHSGLLRFLRRG